MAADSSSSEAKVHIVYTEKPEGQEPEAYHIGTLASVLGSETAAQNAFIYSFGVYGFTAKLSTEQVKRLLKQPEVEYVVKDSDVIFDEPWASNFAHQESGLQVL